MKKLKYYSISRQILEDVTLSPIEKILLGVINTYCLTTGKCYASNSSLSKCCGISEASVKRCLKTMKEKKVIAIRRTKDIAYKTGREIVVEWGFFSVVAKKGVENEPGVAQNRTQGYGFEPGVAQNRTQGYGFEPGVAQNRTPEGTKLSHRGYEIEPQGVRNWATPGTDLSHGGLKNDPQIYPTVTNTIGVCNIGAQNRTLVDDSSANKFFARIASTPDDFPTSSSNVQLNQQNERKVANGNAS